MLTRHIIHTLTPQLISTHWLSTTPSALSHVSTTKVEKLPTRFFKRKYFRHPSDFKQFSNTIVCHQITYLRHTQRHLLPVFPHCRGLKSANTASFRHLHLQNTKLYATHDNRNSNKKHRNYSWWGSPTCSIMLIYLPFSRYGRWVVCDQRYQTALIPRLSDGASEFLLNAIGNFTQIP